MKDNLLPVVNILNSFLEELVIPWNEYNETPDPDSQAAFELASFSRSESVATAYTQAGMLFESAADYSMALVKALTLPATAIAPWGIARSVLEMSALAVWLWDTKIHAFQRVQRSLVFRHKGLVDQLKLANLSKELVDPKKAIARINHAEHIALELGMGNVQTKKNKKQFVFNMQMPTNTEIIKNTLNKEQEYRLLSAMVHGRNWAIQSLGFEITKKNQMIFNNVKGGHLEKHLNESVVNYLCTSTFSFLASTILMKFKLYGWNVKPIATLIKRTQNELAKIQDKQTD